MHNSKDTNHFVLIKINLEKTYDRLSWPTIRTLLVTWLLAMVLNSIEKMVRAFLWQKGHTLAQLG